MVSFEEREKEAIKKREEDMIKGNRNRILEYLSQHGKDIKVEIAKQALLPLAAFHIGEYFMPPMDKESVARCFEKAFNQLLKEGIIRKERNPDPLKGYFYTLA
jgi:hypothetical protein